MSLSRPCMHLAISNIILMYYSCLILKFGHAWMPYSLFHRLPDQFSILRHNIHRPWKKNLHRTFSNHRCTTRAMAKPVEQVDVETGTVLARFPSMAQAVRDTPGTQISGIRRVLRKRQYTCAGYFWRWQGSTDQPRKTKQKASAMTTIQQGRRRRRRVDAAGQQETTADTTITLLTNHKRQTSTNTTYCCYLIASLNPQYSPNKTYIGVTVNPSRRLRQHNRLRQGGAKRTAAARPWEFRVLVTGFWQNNDYDDDGNDNDDDDDEDHETNTSVRRFEYAWQHFDKYRIVRDAIGDQLARKMKRNRTLDGQLAMLKTILVKCPHLYGNAPLTLHFMKEQDLQAFEAINVEEIFCAAQEISQNSSSSLPSRSTFFCKIISESQMGRITDE